MRLNLLRYTSAAMVVCGCLCAPPAGAAETLKALSPWKTGLMSREDGAFAYCVTEAAYPDGQWLLVALNPEGEVNVGLGQQSARMDVGSKREVSLGVDGQMRVLPGQVTKPQLLVISAHRMPDMLQKLAQGTTFTIEGRTFALAGSGAAMAELQECVRVSSTRGMNPPPDNRGAGRAGPTSPLSPVPSAASQPLAQAGVPPTPDGMTPQVRFDDSPVGLPGERGDAPPPDFRQMVDVSRTMPATPSPSAAVSSSEPLPAPLLTPPTPASPASGDNGATLSQGGMALSPTALPAPLSRLLEQAGLKGLTAVAPRSGRESFSWTTARGLRGSVYEVAVPPGQPLDMIARDYLSREAAACAPGSFRMQRGKGEGAGGVLSRLGASSWCTSGNTTAYATYVFSLAPGGILSVITHRQEDGEQGANEARSGLVRALRALQQ